MSSGGGPPVDDAQRLAVVREQLAAHVPADVVEERARSRMLGLTRWLRRPFDQEADATHLTGSAIVMAADGRVVLHRHKRLGIWLQPGGHVDPGEHAAEGARRETLEETGLAARHPDGVPRLVHVDVHPAPRGHLHLDLRYLLLAEAADPLAPAAGESPEVAWFAPDEACTVADGSAASAIRAGLRHLASG